MKKILTALLVLAVIGGVVLFASPFSEKILGTKNVVDDILALLNGGVGGTGGTSGVDPNHVCVFDKQEVSNKFRATAATCESAATYYYSCSCGDRDESKTFVYGDPAPHVDKLTVTGTYKTNYTPGESFDVTGMVVTSECIVCGDKKGEVTDYSIVPGGALTSETKKVTVTYGSAGFDINVTVKDFAVTDVNLVVEENKVYYVVSGIYTEATNLDTLYFDLVTKNSIYTFVGEKKDIVLETNATDHTFEMKADVTDWDPNGSYLYPHIHLDGEQTDLMDASAKWNGIKVEQGGVRYEIVQNTDRATAPYQMPVLKATYIGEKVGKMDYTGVNKNTPSTYQVFKYIDDAGTQVASYELTYVEFVTTESSVHVLFKGVSSGFTKQQLASTMKIQFRRGTTGYIEGSDGGVLEFDAATGNWQVMVNVETLAASNNAYFARFGEYRENNSNVFDCKPDADKVKTASGTSVTIGTKKYTFLYNAGNDAANAYNCVGIKVETVSAE